MSNFCSNFALAKLLKENIMGLFDWFKKKQSVPKIDMNIFPELVLLFPDGKAEMGGEMLRIQDELHRPINEFSRVFVFVVRDLFFDKTLAENIDAISQRIITKSGGKIPLDEAKYLADYILKRVHATTADQKFKYISAVAQQAVGDKFSINPNFTNDVAKTIDTHKSLSDKQFIDAILDHCKFVLFENDNPKGNIYGWLENRHGLTITEYAKKHSIAPLMLYMIKWISELYETNRSLYAAIIYHADNVVDHNVSNEAKQNYVNRRILSVKCKTQEQWDDLYSLTRRYIWFCSQLENRSEMIIKVVLGWNTKWKNDINDRFPSTENLTNVGELSIEAIIQIAIRDFFKASGK